MARRADRYTVISADCHGGGAIARLPRLPRPSLPATTSTPGPPTSTTPTTTSRATTAGRNWDSDRRLAELEADGMVAEVHLPQHHPAVLPEVVARAPAARRADAGDLERRWAGLRAHNRWLADFCAAAPGRRAGIAQILLHDVDAAVAEIRWAADAGPDRRRAAARRAARLGPAAALRPRLRAASGRRARSWACPSTTTRGSAVARLRRLPRGQGHVPARGHLVGPPGAVAPASTAGVLERHPDLQLVFTEQGTAWLPEQLATLDYYHDAHGRRAPARRSTVRGRGHGPAVAAAQRVLGPPVPRRVELHPAPRGRLRHAVGVDRIMWGSDFPHREGCWPFSAEQLRLAFAGVDPAEVAAMVGRQRGRALRLRPRRPGPRGRPVGPARRPTWPARSTRATSPPRPCAARPSPAPWPSDRPPDPPA